MYKIVITLSQIVQEYYIILYNFTLLGKYFILEHNRQRYKKNNNNKIDDIFIL